MCGIYGRVGGRDDALDRKATLTLRHRGPDDAGLLVDPSGPVGAHVVLGHTRLAILDLSPAGHQPMASADGALQLVFNGEIFNFQELRRELEAQGRTFRSHTDTEVILHLYELHGDALLDKLEGMYAIALWDRRRRRLLLARDPSGIKPLFYRVGTAATHAGGEPQAGPHVLTFASEIKALLADPDEPRKPDLRALAGYLSYLYVPPPRTAFQDLRRLDPGHKLVLDAEGRVAVERFHRYTLQPKQHFRSLREAADALEALLTEVVRQHMLADVPVGAFLSGGIDSGLLVALMGQLKRARGDRERVRTYTVGFGSEGKRWDEVSPAVRVARHLDVDHEVVRISPELAQERFPYVARQFDEPFANPTALVHDVLCEGARRHVTVALAGDGGDEAFGGYPRHRATQLLAAWQLVPKAVREQGVPRLLQRWPEQTESLNLVRQARRFLRTGTGSFADVYREWLTFLNPTELRGLLGPAAQATLAREGWPRDLGNTAATLAEAGPGADLLDAACLADLYGFLPNNVLHESDRVSMRHALEVRVPFADRRIVEFGLHLPRPLKLSRLGVLTGGGKASSKRVLREVAARHLPAEVVRAPKQGFGAPMGAWLDGPLAPLVDRATARGTLAERGVVDPDAVARLVQEHRGGQRDRTWNLWSLIVLESWFEQRVDRLVLPETAALRVHVRVLEPVG